ncbi:MAG: hypothetical protein WCX66_02485 [archaeon]
MVKFNKKNIVNKKSITSAIIAGLILLMVFLAGPATAFSVDWTPIEENPTPGEEIEITVTINKNVTEAVDDFVIKLGPEGSLVEITSEDNELSCTNNYPALGYSYNEYGYGYYGYAYNQYGENGYGYSYGYGVNASDAMVCTFNYTPTSYSTNYSGEVYVNDQLVNQYTVFTTVARTSSSGSTTTTTTPTTTTATESVVVVSNETEVVSYTPEELGTVLQAMTDDEGNQLFSSLEIAEMVANASDFEFEVNTLIEKITSSNGSVSYRATITTTIKNVTGKDLKNVKVVVEVPKKVTNSASNVVSATPFTILVNDPVLEFNVTNLKAGQEADIKYTVTSTTQPNLNEVEFAEPAIKEYTVVEETVDSPSGDGDSTNDGVINEPTGVESTQGGFDILPILIILVIVVIVIVAYVKRKDIKKMLK